MEFQRYKCFTVTVFFLLFLSFSSQSQLGISFDIKKPTQFEDRVLGSEKSEQKKFTLPRRFVQNSFTHYNYFFNANNKLNEIIENAKLDHQDDFTALLPFYNYSLDVTAMNKIQLDSVIYKSTTGIVLHDLRGDWIDNMYLLMGAAYYLRKDFDSAYLTFQFLNYAFAEKEKDGYYRNIGSNMDGNNAFSISTKEKKSLAKKVFSRPPSRNDAFIWQIRTLIAQEEYAEAASLIVTLKEDPLFPGRLKNDLDEVQALWFYNNNMYDSAALYLSRGLSNAPTKKEKARWEFLTAQLYELAKNNDMARTYYEKVIGHTLDPVMEIYARLHSIRINDEGGENFIDQNIAELLKMAKRDKYVDYRDVIFYTIAQMEWERNNFEAAEFYLGKSVANNTGNDQLRNKAYLQMADLAFKQKKYRLAYNYYDSIRLSDPTLQNTNVIGDRKEMLGRIATQIEIIERQDSLQKIAAMEEEARKDFVRRIVRQLRKAQGLKDESATPPPAFATSPTTAPDIFTGTSSKGEWYFYNASLRSKGAAEFRAKWGNRPNVDNWRRSNVMSFAATNRPGNVPGGQQASTSTEPDIITFDALYARLPLTEEDIKKSNDSIQEALYILGKALAEEIEDCHSSINRLEELRSRFPQNPRMEEALFTLYYCYMKTGNSVMAESVKKLMNEKYASGTFTGIINTGKDPRKPGSDPEATKKYEQVYDMFIEGRFEEAVNEKRLADSIYGQHYWTPQLLYIEAVYHIRQRNDSIAMNSLRNIVQKFSKTPLADKASNLMRVLGRRAEIEEELTKLQVEPRPQVDTLAAPVMQPVQQIQQPVQQQVETKPQVTLQKKDTIIIKPVPGSYTFKPNEKHMVMIVLNKVDPVWGNETKSAFYRYNREVYYNKTFELNLVDITPEYRVLLIGNFDSIQSAIDYIQKARPVAASQIIPWLKGDKYSFSLITESNLGLLRAAKDLDLYNQFIKQNLPTVF